MSNAALIDEILHRENSAAMLAVRLEAVSAGAEPVTVAVKPHWTEGRKFPYRYTFSAENYEIVRATNEGRLSKHDTFEDQKRRCMRNIEREIRGWQVAASLLRARNQDWRQTHVFENGKFKLTNEAVA